MSVTNSFPLSPDQVGGEGWGEGAAPPSSPASRKSEVYPPHPALSPIASDGGEASVTRGGTENHHRHIRSFVLRQGRFTPAQQRAFELHWARYGLDPRAPLDAPRVFGRRAPLVLEIGFGNGEQLLWAAQHETDKDFIGVEVHRPGVGRLMNALAEHNVDNVRLYNHDVVDVLEGAIAPGMLDEVRIYFPDPWPKKRQTKRRLIQPEFVAALATRVAVGGRLHLATDWADYAAQMREVMDNASGWRSLGGADGFIAQPAWRTQTHFEKRGRKLGHGVWDLLHERC
ncbi:MAG: tRNA (guanosine(46)-N7)-methyltransferase TrmB [Proteobacteria bacterium]|nr:tRNA (guanosine(46)-N7)-methyltransferase TrmB [Pseudomonadota bacterium]